MMKKNSEGELSVHMRMQYTCFTVDLKKLRVQCCRLDSAGCGWYQLQYTCFTVDLKKLRVQCCGLDSAGCGWYQLVCELSNVLSDSTRL